MMDDFLSYPKNKLNSQREIQHHQLLRDENIQRKVPYNQSLGDENAQCHILYNLLEEINLNVTESSHFFAVINCTELDLILSMLEQMTRGSSYTIQDVFTLASYTIRLISEYLKHQNNARIGSGEEYGETRKRKFDNITSSFSSDTTPGLPSKDNNKQSMWIIKILQLMIEILTVLRNIPTYQDDHSEERITSSLDPSINLDTTEGISFTVLYHTIRRLALGLPFSYHSSLAAVLCRTAMPECSHILLHLVSLFPLSVPCFVRGCIDAFKIASDPDDPRINIIQNVAKDSVRSIALKSPLDSTQVQSILRQKKVMPDIFILLLLEQNRGVEHTILSELLQPSYESIPDQCCYDHNNKVLPKNGTISQDRCSWIQRHLRENENTTRVILLLLGRRLTDLTTQQGTTVSRGQACLVVHTMAMLLVNLDMQLNLSDQIRTLLDTLMKIAGMYPRLSAGDHISSLDGDFSFSSLDDHFFKLLFCFCILLAITNFSSQNDHSLLAPCQTCFMMILQSRVSNRFLVFTRNVLELLYNQKEQIFGDLLAKTLDCRMFTVSKEIFQVFSTWARLMLDMPEGRKNRIADRRIDQNVLSDPKQCMDVVIGKHILSLYRFVDIWGEMVGLPLLLPWQVEKLERSLGLHKPSPLIMENHGFNDNCRYFIQYLFHITYSLLFLDKSSTSLLAVDPRELHLIKALSISEELVFSNKSAEELSNLLFSLAAKYCPESVASWKVSQHLCLRVGQATSRMNTAFTSLESVLLHSFPKYGKFDENLLVLSRLRVSDIDTKIVEMIYESVEKRRIIISRHSFYQDPLQIFKFPIAIWESPTVRNILLSILQRIFVVNCVLTTKRSPSSDVGIELITARDVITVKCLTTIYEHLRQCRRKGSISDSNGGPVNITEHEMLINFIRWLLAQKRGSTTFLNHISFPESMA